MYEWTDREGQIHQSAPSNPVGVGADYGLACADGDHVDIDVSCLHFGDPERLERVRVVMYRTVDDGTIFYRLPDSINLFNALTGAMTVSDGVGAQRRF